MSKKPKRKSAKRKSISKKSKPYALLSVSDKQGLDKFAKGLKELGFELISSGGTAAFLKKAGIKVTEVSKLTKYPHMLDGRVKTLHPIIHGAILADQTNPKHLKELKKFGINPFQIVVCNLYPFEKIISQGSFTHEEAIENIDIGGPCMVRAAAKNHKSVAIVVDPSDYETILAELKENSGKISDETRERLSFKAFRQTKSYDSVIVKYFESRFAREADFPSRKEIYLEKVQDLRYGENPHQKAALYREIGQTSGSHVTQAKQLHGKELSFNNYVDMDAAWSAANSFADTTVAIIKHTNPCGLASDPNLAQAYKKAYAGDPVSAFGGIVAANRRIDEETALEIKKLFVEVVIAPGFTPKALAMLREKQNLRIMEMGEGAIGQPFAGLDMKRISGGLLLQEPDLAQLGINEAKVVTKKQPTLEQMEDLFFAWNVAKYVKSNTIVLASDKKAIG
ncbi:MAG: bifunctional phosphoribosylaminoimidazolecarboxamide formyltransferase/IMP cyclohydrolase, partial [bacterium]